jgi:XTP/dITP diphosphohydrolase
MNNASSQFERLVRIMNELRDQCPWDRSKPSKVFAKAYSRKTYELADATGRLGAIKEN